MIFHLAGKYEAYVFGIFFILGNVFGLAAFVSVFSSSFASIFPLYGMDSCNIYDGHDFANECWIL